MNSLPLIGLSSGNYPHEDWGGGVMLDCDVVNRQYAEAVVKGGGLPFIVPSVRGLLAKNDDDLFSSGCGPEPMHENARFYMSRLDGLILTGGGDIAPGPQDDPSLYRDVDRRRDQWDMALAGAALALGKPVLGICRGMQVLNVAFGGTMWADLPTQCPGPVEHQQKITRNKATHSVTLETGSFLNRITSQQSLMVNSGHHQAIKELAADFKVAARSDDGVIEAIEHRTALFAFGLQWHPEALSGHDRHTRLIFASFVQAASSGKK